jgi:nitrogen fixation protein NifU and related proteins
MSSSLRELYQEVILDHNRRPRNYRDMADASGRAEGHNPLCGDRVTVFVRREGDLLADVSFQGSGCAISRAAASLMTERVKGEQLPDVVALFEVFQAMVTSAPDAPVDDGTLGKLEVFAGVREYPSRVKCATLAWHALLAAVEHRPEVVTTEQPGDM